MLELADVVHHLAMTSVEFEAAAAAFLRDAFVLLLEERVLPTSVFHANLAVGRDYTGPEVMTLSGYEQLVAVLARDWPSRFREPLKRSDPEFPNSYVFPFLEAAVFLCRQEPELNPFGPGAVEATRQLRDSLDRVEEGVTCCRVVAHVTTVDGSEVIVSGVTVVPEPSGFGGLNRRIVVEVPGALRVWDRKDPRVYDPPLALLVVKSSTGDSHTYAAAAGLSSRIGRFLLLARLLTAGTAQSLYEVRGPSSLFSPSGALADYFAGDRPGQRLVRRSLRLSGAETPAFDALGEMVDAAQARGEGLITTSFSVALTNFDASHEPTWAFVRLVGLSTALEAALIGSDKDTDALTLRLRSRAAALLATDEDPASAVFADVGLLYGLRSKIVHGGQVRVADLRKTLGRLSTMPAGVDGANGIGLEYAVDRLRDLVRRAILARLLLARDPNSVWPLTGDLGVDALLSDDATRSRWRTLWQTRLVELGVREAGHRPRSAVEFYSTDDR